MTNETEAELRERIKEQQKQIEALTPKPRPPFQPMSREAYRALDERGRMDYVDALVDEFGANWKSEFAKVL